MCFTVGVNQNSKVVGHENQNIELKDVKMPCGAERNCAVE